MFCVETDVMSRKGLSLRDKIEVLDKIKKQPAKKLHFENLEVLLVFRNLQYRCWKPVKLGYVKNGKKKMKADRQSIEKEN